MVINILLPHYGYRPTGGFKVVYIYANKFVKKGINVNLVYPATCRKGIRAIPGWIRTYKNRKNRSEWFDFEEGVNRIYTSSLCEKNIPNADFTVATSYETSLFLNLYSSSKGKKIYLIQDLEIWAGKRDVILQSWNFDMCKIAVSQHLMNIGKDVGVKNLHYVPNAIDLRKYQSLRNIEDRKDCVAMMYSKAERKGAIYGIEAIKRIKVQKPNVEAILFGKFPRPVDLPTWIEYYENPEQAFLVSEIYNRAKVFICSSIYEGWGLPAMEAMACGCAVVTTDCGGVRDFAIPEVTALVCPIKNVEALVTASIELLNNNVLYKMLIENALQKIQEFSWEKSEKKFLEILDSV